MHPYEVAQTLRTRHKHESTKLNYGSLYGVVEAMERRGHVAAVETVREGRRPERTVYAITPAGTHELLDWLSELVSTPAKEYPRFATALSLLPALAPDLAVELLRERVRSLEVLAAQNRATADALAARGLPRLFSIEVEHGIALMEAEATFAAGLADAIADGSLDGVDLWRSWAGPDGTSRPDPAHVRAITAAVAEDLADGVDDAAS